jgi:hypothetical protein
VPLSDYAVFAARRVIAAPNLYEDANVFRFDMENGGQAVMLTNRTGTGTSSAVRNIESVTVAGDPLFVAWAERLGIVATSSEDVYVTSILGNAEVRRVSAANPAGQSVVDGSIRFTCVPAAGVVWAVGQGRLDVPEDNVAVQWSALGSAGPLTRLSPAPVLTRVFQVIGVSQ